MLGTPALLLALSVASAVPAGGAQKQDGDAVDAVVACRDIADTAARLACFDRNVKTLAEAKQRKDIVVMDREGVRAAKRGLFGFSLPRIKLFGDGGGDSETDVKQIDSIVTTARAGVGGLMTIALKDGTVWQTTEARMGFSPRSGDEITITAGALGSYMAKIKGGRSSKVKRVN
ncbi:hypothetical protein [Sphingomonas koreensis]